MNPNPTNDFCMLPNLDKPEILDIHMYVGKEYYTVREAVLEYSERGISKHISITSIPDGLEPGRSRIFLSHMEAILEVTAEGAKLLNLLQALFLNGATIAEELLDQLGSPELDSFWNTPDGGLQPGDYVPSQMLNLVMALESLPDRQPIVDALGIKFHPGVFGYGYLSRIEYVCKEGEDELPDDLKHLDGYITPVIVEYEDNENGINSTQDW